MNAPLPTGWASGWTAERVGQLRHHYRVGLTAAESALLIGGVSRNAVIAKRNRLGLTGLARPPSAPVADAAPRSRAPRIRAEPQFRSHPLPPMDSAPPPDARPKPLAQHRAGECLWPLGAVEAPGDWRTLFCCAPVRRTLRYCAVHRDRARR